MSYRDHPRVCGEHPLCVSPFRGSVGSSPRMRGTLIPHLRRAGRTGIIPAYAGNTIRAGPPLPEHRDHPRVCGEHLSSVTMTTRTVGSSPRMRGTLTANTQPARAFGSSPRMRGTRECRTRHAVPLRIIPAYAGNTKPVWRTPRGIWDHPRVCGEHLSTFLIYVITKFLIFVIT